MDFSEVSKVKLSAIVTIVVATVGVLAWLDTRTETTIEARVTPLAKSTQDLAEQVNVVAETGQKLAESVGRLGERHAAEDNCARWFRAEGLTGQAYIDAVQSCMTRVKAGAALGDE